MIVEKIGIPAMYEMLAEECCELAQAALKMARIMRGENPTPKTMERVKENLIEEVTDVELCLKELSLGYDVETMAKKIKRFQERWDDFDVVLKKIKEAGK